MGRIAVHYNQLYVGGGEEELIMIMMITLCGLLEKRSAHFALLITNEEPRRIVAK